MMGQKTYRERCIDDFGWDPIAPKEGVRLKGNVRENTVRMLTDLCGFEPQDDGSFVKGDSIAVIEPYYALPYPVIENGEIIAYEISHMLTSYKKLSEQSLV
jgi:hypothetical protein